MDVSLYQAAAAMNASARWQQVISENLAANQIPGFKKQSLSFSAVQAGFMAGPAGASSAAVAKRATMPLASTSTNFQAGELHSTGVNTDLAIEGPGFFEVRMPDSTSGFTRDGQFRLTSQGQLVTSQGLPVMGPSGPLQVDASNPAPVVVAANGEVSQGGEAKGQLKLTEFGNPSALAVNGAGLFVDADPAALRRAASASTVRQGFLENANTSSVSEMASLISSIRFYEANQKVIQAEDERVGRLISDVANPSQ
jgi:flagellar basal body rod protein FlgG